MLARFPAGLGALNREVLLSGWPEPPQAHETLIMTLSAQLRLQICLSLLPAVAEAYRHFGWPEDVLAQSLEDLWLRMRLYRDQNAQWGLTAEDGQWLLRIFAGKIFKCGVLQFERTHWHFTEPEYHLHFTGPTLPEGSPILAVHVMAGENLAQKNVLAAFQASQNFFKGAFPKERYLAYTCYSWLLYPPLLRALPADSRIRHFGENFTVVAVSSKQGMARERILTAAPAGKQGSSLQHLVQDQPELMGVGLGYRPIKEEEDWQN